MRLIAWNANYNNRHRSFEADLDRLDGLNADVIVLSETARPRTEATGQVFWIGDEAPGLVVAARNGYSLEPIHVDRDAARLSGAFRVFGPMNFSLLAVWPVKWSQKDSYGQILNTCLERHASLLSGERVILAGDLNSNSRVSGQAKSHPLFVSKVTALGLTSVYHHQAREEHGAETKGTYRRSRTSPQSFCIDYCFVSKPWLDSASLQILDDEKWQRLSDHFPLVLEIPDRP